MPISSWLRALFSKPVPPNPTPDQPPQPLAQDDLIRAQSAAADETARANWVPSQDFIDNGVRMHIAAHDPEFPQKREAAVKTIIAVIDPVAAAHGFTKKPKSWAKTGPLGTVSIHLQRSRYGFDCHINLGFQPVDDDGHGPWAQDDFVRLGRFYPPNATGSGEPGTLTYLDVHQEVGCLDLPMQVLSLQALPWLLAQLTDPAAHSLPFLSGPVQAQN